MPMIKINMTTMKFRCDPLEVLSDDGAEMPLSIRMALDLYVARASRLDDPSLEDTAKMARNCLAESYHAILNVAYPYCDLMNGQVEASREKAKDDEEVEPEVE